MRKKLTVLFICAALFFIAAACAGKQDAPEKLPAPSGLSCENGVVTFDAVEGAQGYVLEINGRQISVSGLSYSLDSYQGQVEIRVKAAGDGTVYADSEFSAVITVTLSGALETPSGVSVSGNVISWSAVDGAVGYTLLINGKEYSAADNSFTTDITGEVRISVKALGDGILHFDSEYSDVFYGNVPYQLEAPARFRYSAIENTLKWEPSEGATGYTVTVGTETVSLARNADSLSAARFGDSFSATIVATGDPDICYDSQAVAITVAPQTVTEISSEEELRAIEAGGSYRLTADIALTRAWTPVDFWGTFDGDGHTVSGVEIASTASEAGFFAMLSDAVVSDLKLEDVTVSATASGTSYAGAFAGRVECARVTGCEVSGAVIDATGYHTGGFVGNVADGSEASFTDCFFSGTVNVSGGGYAGGFAATVRTNAAEFVRCGVSGSVNGGGVAGGFAGHIGYGNYEDCYAVAEVYASSQNAVAGGFVGLLDGRNVKISTSFCAGDVQAPDGSYEGGFAGIVPTGAFTGGDIFSNCYYDGTVYGGDRIGNATVGRGDGITSSATLKSGSLPSGFDSSVWTAAADEYPGLG